jgi:hypothetical protein
VFDWPVFNVADSAVSVGVVILAYLLWRGFPQDDGAGSNATPPSKTDTAPHPAVEPVRSAPMPRVRNPRPRSR